MLQRRRRKRRPSEPRRVFRRAALVSLAPENLGSAQLELSPEDLVELDRASASVQVQGDRYPEAMQRMIDR